MSPSRRLTDLPGLRWLGDLRWPGALALALVIGLAAILPGLGGPGLWDLSELPVADQAVTRVDAVRAGKDPDTAAKGPAPTSAECLKAVPPGAAARSLDARATEWGFGSVGESDRGMRLPFALLAIVTVLAAAGIGLQLGGPVAGALSALVLVSFPLLILQGRQITSEIGTAAGAAMLVCGLLMLRPGRGLAVGRFLGGVVLTLAGLVIGFLDGGALLGVLVPVGAVALSAGAGLPVVAAAGRGLMALLRRPSLARATGIDDRAIHWLGLATAIGAAVLVYVLAHQLYDIRGLEPGSRQVLGHSIVPSNCYASAVGAVWRSDDNLAMLFDSATEQVAYGTFPWGIAAPLALSFLLAAPTAAARRSGALLLGWSGGAWIATEVFHRKAGYAVYAGFPAMAIAVGIWLDQLLVRPPTGTGPRRIRVLTGLFVLVAVVAFGKDLQTFPGKLVSLLTGAATPAYPVKATLLGLSLKVWLLVVGVLVALPFALAMWITPDDARPPRDLRVRVARMFGRATLVTTALAALFWSYGWLGVLSHHLSSKPIFAHYRDLRKDGDTLAILGDLGNAPRYYADATWEKLAGRPQLLAALSRTERVFALAPAGELCAVHRELAGKAYFVLDDDNPKTLLLSNKLDGGTDHNPLTRAILHAEPTSIATRPPTKIVFDNKIELLGWTIPAVVGRSDAFEVEMVYKIIAPVGGSWKVFMHLDNGSSRYTNGDHEPIGGRCPTSYWQPGDYIVDRFTIDPKSGSIAGGTLTVWTGFFTGSNPNWRNMPVTTAPAGTRDNDSRVNITTIKLR